MAAEVARRAALGTGAVVRQVYNYQEGLHRAQEMLEVVAMPTPAAVLANSADGEVGWRGLIVPTANRAPGQRCWNGISSRDEGNRGQVLSRQA